MVGKILIVATLLMAVSTSDASAQGLLDRIARKAEQAIEKKAGEVIDRTVDKAIPVGEQETSDQPQNTSSTPATQSQDNEAAPTSTAPSVQTPPVFTGATMTIEQLTAKYSGGLNGAVVMTIQGQMAQGMAGRSAAQVPGGANMDMLTEIKSATVVMNQSGNQGVSQDMLAVVNNDRYLILAYFEQQGVNGYLAITKEDKQDDEQLMLIIRGSQTSLIQLVGEMTPEAHRAILQAKADGSLERQMEQQMAD